MVLDVIHHVSKCSNELEGNHRLVLCTSKNAALQFWCSEYSTGDLEHLPLVLWEYTPQFFVKLVFPPPFLGRGGHIGKQTKLSIFSTCCCHERTKNHEIQSNSYLLNA